MKEKKKVSDLAQRGAAWNQAAPVLFKFCNALLNSGVRPIHARPEQIAALFCRYFQAEYPFNRAKADALIRALGVLVIFSPGLTRRTGKNRARGAWVFFESGDFYILVDPSPKQANGRRSRPMPSLVFTLLHELAEIILDICNAIDPCHGELNEKQREPWANHFASMAMMPPSQFKCRANALKLDLRALVSEFETTLASTARQVRDVERPGQTYYFTRCGIVYNPEKCCSELAHVVEASMGGTCTKVLDVVRSRGLGRTRAQSGGLPLYNLPGSWEYRVMHPVVTRECINRGNALFIEHVSGASCLEAGKGYDDLFKMNRLAVLIYPYGVARTKGLFLQAVAVNQAHILKVQAMERNATVVADIDWLFSNTSVVVEKKKVASPQRRLPSSISDDGKYEAPFPWLPEVSQDSIAKTFGKREEELGL